MKAAVVVAGGGVEIRDVPQPTPKPNEVLVKVRAAGLNRADVGVAAGHAHGAVGGAGTIVGLEWSGEIAAIGSEVKTVKPGDRVMCSGSGGYAEYAVTDWGRATPIPANNTTFQQAPPFPVPLHTIH